MNYIFIGKHIIHQYSFAYGRCTKENIDEYANMYFNFKPNPSYYGCDKPICYIKSYPKIEYGEFSLVDKITYELKKDDIVKIKEEEFKIDKIVYNDNGTISCYVDKELSNGDDKQSKLNAEELKSLFDIRLKILQDEQLKTEAVDIETNIEIEAVDIEIETKNDKKWYQFWR